MSFVLQPLGGVTPFSSVFGAGALTPDGQSQFSARFASQGTVAVALQSRALQTSPHYLNVAANLSCSPAARPRASRVR